MLGKKYKSLINQIAPHKNLVERTSLLMKSELKKSETRKKRAIHNRLAVTAAICICIVLSIPVMAAIPSFHHVLYKVAPEIAQFLQPVEMSSKSNDIRMNIIAAMNDEDTAVVYLTLQDLTGSRVDETVDLYNYSIKGFNAFTHDLVDFDEKTNTATIRMLAHGGEKLNGNKITLQLKSFLSDKIFSEDVRLDIEMKDIPNTKKLPLDMSNLSGGGGPGFEELRRTGTVNILKPHKTEVIHIKGINFVSISGIGYGNGFLHIQTDWKESVDNHGYILLKDHLGNEVSPYANLSFNIDENDQVTSGNRYREYIYQIPKEELSKYKAYGYFIANGHYTEGDWQVTFKLNPVGETSLVAKNLEVDGITIDALTVTPLGIHIVGKQADIKDLDIQAITDAGERINYNSIIRNSYNGIFKIKYVATLPVPIDTIEEIKINGSAIPAGQFHKELNK
ncbi:MAG: hypothetical protein ACOWWO_11790 [Peptococcaceae bacterium]